VPGAVVGPDYGDNQERRSGATAWPKRHSIALVLTLWDRGGIHENLEQRGLVSILGKGKHGGIPNVFAHS
jgi:hypothetical protein